MTIFKTFLKIINKYKITVIIYTTILLIFGIFNITTNDSAMDFSSSKPNILIINNDSDKGLTRCLINYLKENANIIENKTTEEEIDDAIFYREANYVIYIPKGYNELFMTGENPTINIKSTGDYQASLANLILERFLNMANIYQKNNFSEEEIIKNINSSLNNSTNITLTSKLDREVLLKASNYFNFASYSLMAGAIQIICLVLSTFRNKNILKRTLVSGLDYKTYNRKLLLANSIFSIVLWLFYILLSFILIGDIMFTTQGLLFVVNSFIFTIIATIIAFLIGNLITDKNAINGIVNTIALGSAFLCGAFVPQEYLPTSVLNIAHILPSYWFIASNELIKKLELVNFETLKPIIINFSILVLFGVIFIIITLTSTKKKQKVL